MKRAISYFLLCAAVLGDPHQSVAHEVRPGLLELRETSPDTYSML